MARYTKTVEISFNCARHMRVVNAEGGDVVINQSNGINFVPTGTTILAGQSELICTTGLTLQFVVNEGCAVNIEEGECR